MRARAKKYTRNATGLSPGVLLAAAKSFALHEVKTNRSLQQIGRQAPV
jgi:hypothetical protein